MMERHVQPRGALYWDESFLWGLMAFSALSSSGISFDPVTAGEIRQGGLSGYDFLFVPGGWAGDKSRSLGEEGKRLVREFVERGGRYIGFCGGAGLALDVPEGLSLLPVKRVPTRDRIPNFSGRIRVVPSDRSHPIWRGLSDPLSFHAWWPGQFALEDAGGYSVTARYGAPERDFYVADLFAEDVDLCGPGWPEWEAFYGIHMNPGRLEGEPAMVEGAFGRGNVFLSYLHLDTPDDPAGLKALGNLLDLPPRQEPAAGGKCVRPGPEGDVVPIGPEVLKILGMLKKEAEDLVRFGERNYLWYWRNSYLLQWRRGVRGMEPCIILVMTRELHHRILALRRDGRGLTVPRSLAAEEIPETVEQIHDLAGRFFRDAKRLLLRERLAMNRGVLHALRSDDPEIRGLRERLFSGSKRFGGIFKDLIDRIDRLLLMVIRSSGPCRARPG